jgi:5-methylcytosine-specific restriction protein A
VVDRPTSSENLATESPSTESLATKRNPTWSPEELILALDLYLREGVLDHSHNLVVELSEALNKLPIHSDRPDAARFRNPNGVALKLANFAALDPGHPGKGMTRGGKRDSEIWNKFSGDEDALREAAEKIRAGVDWPLPRSSASVLAQVSTIELEALNTEHFVVHRATTAEAVRREQQLVRDYAEHLLAQGHKIVRHKYDLEGNPLYCDLFDETSWLLHEAKGDVRRESVRMAVGQLLDYARFYQKKPKLVVLLPREPSADIKEFLAAVGIQGVFRDSSGAWARSTVSAVPTPA